MVVRKTKSRKKVVAKKKKVAKTTRSPKTVPAKVTSNFKTYEYLEKKIHEAWKKLCKDVKKRDKAAILQDREELKLLLGECHYMMQECKKCMRA